MISLKAVRDGLGRMGGAGVWAACYYLLPSLLLLFGVILWFVDPPVLVDMRSRVFDEFLRKNPREYDPSAPVVIVDIDDESLGRPELGQWPWPRTRIAQLVDRLSAAGAGVVAFDVIFSETDRTSPERIAAIFPKNPETALLKEKLSRMPAHDGIFARSITAAENVVLGVSLKGESSGRLPKIKATVEALLKQAVGKKRMTVEELKKKAAQGGAIGFDELETLNALDYLDVKYVGAESPLPALEAAAAGLGSVNSNRDRDGVIRRVPLFIGLGNTPFPSLVAESLRVAFGGRNFQILCGNEGGLGEMAPGILSVLIRSPALPEPFKILTDSSGNVLLWDTGYRPERFLPAWKVLFDPNFDPTSVEGKIVLVGTSAAGLKDLRGTPLNPNAAGVEIHAQIAEQILLGKFLRRPAWAEWMELFAFSVVGLVLILLYGRLGPVVAALISAGTIAGFLGGCWWAFSNKGFQVDPIYPSLVVFLVYLSATIFNYLRTHAEKKQVRGAFGRYLSPALVEQLAADPSRLSLGGEIRELTLMFSDIRGFTTISEQFDAHGLTSFINRYLTPMTDIILKDKGTIDKYMGDCIMAFWNAPLPDSAHARNACIAALTMRTRLKELNEAWEKEAVAQGRKFIPIHAGIGLNSGNCCVGNMGSDQRFDYSVLGDEVNLASRLEGQSKNYGVDIVIGQNTRNHVSDFAAIELDLIKVKGKTVPIRIYTLLGDEKEAASPQFARLSELNARMITAYRAREWDEAERLVAECRELGFPLDGFYDLYSERIAEARLNPPEPSWDGSYTATSK